MTTVTILYYSYYSVTVTNTLNIARKIIFVRAHKMLKCQILLKDWLVYTQFLHNPRDQRSKTRLRTVIRESKSGAKVGKQHLAL